MANYQILPFDLPATAFTTSWFRNLGTRTTSPRAIHGTLVSGDTITIQMTNEPLVAERSVMSTPTATNDYAVIVSGAASTPFQATYEGNYQWVRIVKTGTAGVARVLVEC